MTATSSRRNGRRETTPVEQQILKHHPALSVYRPVFLFLLLIICSASVLGETITVSYRSSSHWSSLSLVEGNHTFRITDVPASKDVEWRKDYSGGVLNTSWWIGGWGTYTATFNVSVSSSDYELVAYYFEDSGDKEYTHQRGWNLTVSTPNSPPGKPGNLDADDRTEISADISWDAASDDDGDRLTYEIEYKKHMTFWGSAHKETSSSESVRLTGLATGQKYDVRVRAHDGQEPGEDWCKVDGLFTTLPEHDVSKPDKPNPSDSSVYKGEAITFSTGGAECSHGHGVEYRFYWGDGDSSSWGGTSRSHSYDETGQYDVYVKARCDDGEYSDQSNRRTITVSNRKPSKPSNLDADDITETSADISWDAASDDDRDSLTYYVEYKRDRDYSWNPAGSTSSTSETLMELDTNTRYDVRVRAHDGEEPGDWHQEDGLFTTDSVGTLRIQVRKQNDKVPPDAEQLVEINLWQGDNLKAESVNPNENGVKTFSGSEVEVGEYYTAVAYYKGQNPFNDNGELWGKGSCTLEEGDNAITIVRNMPYCKALTIEREDESTVSPGEQIAEGAQIILVATVINPSTEDHSAKVRFALDTGEDTASNGDFSVFDYTAETDAVPVAAGQTRRFEHTFEITAAGEYHKAVMVTKTDGTPSKTDAWDWDTGFTCVEPNAALPAVVRNWNDEVPAEAESRCEVVLYDNAEEWNQIAKETTDEDGKVSFDPSDVSPDETYNLEAYYRGQDVFDSLDGDEGELWSVEQTETVNGTNPTVSLTRDFPYANDIRVYKEPYGEADLLSNSDAVLPGATLKLVADITNKQGGEHDVRVTFVLDRNKDASFDYSPSVVATLDATEDSVTPVETEVKVPEEGTYFKAVKVEWKKPHTDEWVKTDAWDWCEAYSVEDTHAPYQYVQTIQPAEGEDYGFYVSLNPEKEDTLNPLDRDYWMRGVVSFCLTRDPTSLETIISRSEYLSSNLPSSLTAILSRMPRVSSGVYGKRVKGDDGFYYIPYNYMPNLWEWSWKGHGFRKKSYKACIREAISLTGFPADAESTSLEDESGRQVAGAKLPGGLGTTVDSLVQYALTALDEAGIELGEVTELTRKEILAESDEYLSIAVTFAHKAATHLEELHGENSSGLTHLRRIFSTYPRLKNIALWGKKLEESAAVPLFALSFAKRAGSELMMREYLRTSHGAAKRLQQIRTSYDNAKSAGQDVDAALGEALTEVQEELAENKTVIDNALDALFSTVFSTETLTSSLDILGNADLPLSNKLLSRVAARINCSQDAQLKALFGGTQKLAVWLSLVTGGIELYEKENSVRSRMASFMTLNYILLLEQRSSSWLEVGDTLGMQDSLYWNQLNLQLAYHAYTLDMLALEYFGMAPGDWLSHGVSIVQGAFGFHTSAGVSLAMPLATFGIKMSQWVVGLVNNDDLAYISQDAERILRYLEIHEENNLKLAQFLEQAYLTEAASDIKEVSTPLPFALHAIKEVTVKRGESLTIPLRCVGLPKGANVSYSENCDFASVADGSLLVAPSDDQELGEHEIEITGVTTNDVQDNTRFQVLVAAKDNNPPRISGLPSTQVMVGETFVFVPFVEDEDPDKLAFDFVNKPGWMEGNASTGCLSGTPALDDVGTYAEITIRATDAADLATTLDPFSVEVFPQSQGTPPEVTPASVSLIDDTAAGTVVHSVEATDPQGDIKTSDGYAITGGNTKDVFAIDDSGQITLADPSQLDYETQDQYELEVTVTDEEGSAGTGTIIVTVKKPTIGLDVNGDGQVLTNDLILLFRKVNLVDEYDLDLLPAGMVLAEGTAAGDVLNRIQTLQDEGLLDVNEDGSVLTNDLILIFRKINLVDQYGLELLPAGMTLPSGVTEEQVNDNIESIMPKAVRQRAR